MPTYKLTLWGTQVLRDEDTYYVLADTKERAAALLSKLHDQACETGKPVESSSATCLYHPDDEQAPGLAVETRTTLSMHVRASWTRTAMRSSRTRPTTSGR